MFVLLLLLAAAAAPAADRFSFGVLGGVPLTAVADGGRTAGRYGGDTAFHIQRYLPGAFTVSIRISHRVSGHNRLALVHNW